MLTTTLGAPPSIVLKSVTLLDLKTYTVDLVIFACLNFPEFVIFGTSREVYDSRIINFDDISSIIIIILFAKFLNSRICPREIRES